MKLRDYQQSLLDELYAKEETSTRVAVCAATGSGKSVVLAKLCLDDLAIGRKTLVLAHRNLLIDQLADTLSHFGIDVGYIKSGYPFDANKQVYVSSVQTLGRRQVDIHWDRIILDEAHICSHAKCVQDLMEALPETYFTGFTATPFPSTKKKNIRKYYQTQVVAPIPKELMEKGFLSWDEYYTFPTYKIADMGALKVNTWGEFDTSDLSKMCRKSESIANTVNEYVRLAGKRQAIAFCADVAHSKALHQAFLAQGIAAEHIDGTFGKVDRKRIYAAFRAGTVKVLINCSVLTEGADFPAIECVILACPYRSKARYVQAVGRGLRSSPDTGKENCLILDHGQNVASRFGRIRDFKIDDYLLQPYNPKTGDPPVKECPQCHHVNYASARKCEKCEYEFPIKTKEVDAIQGELVKFENTEVVNAPKKAYTYKEMNDFYSKKVKLAFYGKKHISMPLAMLFNEFKGNRVGDLSAITEQALFGEYPTHHQIRSYGLWAMKHAKIKAEKEGNPRRVRELYQNYVKREFGKLAHTDDYKHILNKIWKEREHVTS